MEISGSPDVVPKETLCKSFENASYRNCFDGKANAKIIAKFSCRFNDIPIQNMR